MFIRPGADDVLVLKKEMIHAQTLMDQITQDGEREKQKLKTENSQLTTEKQRYLSYNN